MLYKDLFNKKYILIYDILFKEKLLFFLCEVKRVMIIEISFGLVGGINFGLEKSWGVIKNIMAKYPYATWEKIVDLKKGIGRYVIKID